MRWRETMWDGDPLSPDSPDDKNMSYVPPRPLPNSGVMCWRQEPFTDARGSLAVVTPPERTFASWLQVQTIRAGTIRGLHFQREPYAQAKVIRVTRGRIFDVFVDIRPSSPTYGQYGSLTLSQLDYVLYIPEGFAHGYQTLTDNVCVDYLVSASWNPDAEGGLRWNDPSLQIVWPMVPSLINERDAQWPDVVREG